MSKHYKSPFGLNGKERQRAREIAVYAAMVAYHNRDHMIYSEGSARWSGIDDHRLGYKGEFPRVTDCSGFDTWALWNAFEHFHIHGDHVNGEGWREGYTGTMTQHGIGVHLNALLPADSIFYGGTVRIPQHVAIYVGSGRVVSHGHQGGPLLLPMDLGHELPIVQARRYIR
jgi:cell wall-associated NlpC family hydrolase